jgi:acetyl esterase/lipase
MRLSCLIALVFPALASVRARLAIKSCAISTTSALATLARCLTSTCPRQRPPSLGHWSCTFTAAAGKNGSKDQAGVLFGLIKDRDYAGASINYRLTNEAIWPAQIHDCKAAIRALRAHAAENQIDPDKIAVFGISAGGHLVSLLGVTGGVKELEGELGPNLTQSSRVTCVLDFCGPSNFLTFAGEGTIINVDDPKTGLSKLIGGTVKNKPDVARSASPVTYITEDDAPFLIIHGDKDNIVRYAQATEFDAALAKAQIPATLLTGTDGGHVFFSAPLIGHMRAFLDRHLLGKDVQIPEGPVPSK